MAFVNTRDTIGDQATVDGLVEHSLTELKEDGIRIIEKNACYYNPVLTAVELPAATKIRNLAFGYCTSLETVQIGGHGSSGRLELEHNAFLGCKKLKHLILDRPIKATMSSVSPLSDTSIALGEGAVYVPENLVATYEADAVWKNYFIKKLSDYPLSNFDRIEDSWSTILSNPSYATAYTVKDTKTLELTDGTKIKMDLAALDTDVKSDNSGNAKMTWICHGISYSHRMNATNTAAGGWADSEMRSWLISDILSKIPTEIKSHIVSVKKSYRSKSPNDETLWSDDEIWIPSYKEVGFANASYIESDGVVYSGLFNSNATRIKYNTSDSVYYWWLRSAGDAPNFRRVTNNGNEGNYSAVGDAGVAFGFCTD